MLRVQRRRRGIVTHSFESRCRVVLTVVWITFTLLIAMFVPDMADVISVIGGISAFFIFIFPGMSKHDSVPMATNDDLNFDFFFKTEQYLILWSEISFRLIYSYNMKKH